MLIRDRIHLPELGDIPQEDVRVVTVRAGLAKVVHVASGIELGTVEREGAGTFLEWLVRTGDGVALKWGEETREHAVSELRDPLVHHPGTVRISRQGRDEKLLTEEESRRAFPEAWAWWDKVRPLFPAVEEKRGR